MSVRAKELVRAFFQWFAAHPVIAGLALLMTFGGGAISGVVVAEHLRLALFGNKIFSYSELEARDRSIVAQATQDLATVKERCETLRDQNSWLKLQFENEKKRCDSFRCDLETERIKLVGWKFNEPLYEKLPVDCDFMVRDLQIKKEAGSHLRVGGPSDGEYFIIAVSNWFPKKEGGHAIGFSIEGHLDSNIFFPRGAEPITVARHVMAGPFQALPYEFFVHIDEIHVDHLTVTVARRRAKNNTRMIENVSIGGGGFSAFGEAPVKTVLEAAPTTRK